MLKLLKRALKVSLAPAVLMIVVKFVAVFGVAYFQDFDYTIGNNFLGLFTVQVYFNSPTVTTYVNSISNFFLLLAIGIPTFYLHIKEFYYRKAQGNPKTIVKLTKLNLLKWITSQKSGFLNAFIWTCFLWITSAIIISSTLNSGTYLWIGVISALGIILSAWGLLTTFELETARIYPEDKHGYL